MRAELQVNLCTAGQLVSNASLENLIHAAIVTVRKALEVNPPLQLCLAVKARHCQAVAAVLLRLAGHQTHQRIVTRPCSPQLGCSLLHLCPAVRKTRPGR